MKVCTVGKNPEPLKEKVRIAPVRYGYYIAMLRYIHTSDDTICLHPMKEVEGEAVVVAE